MGAWLLVEHVRGPVLDVDDIAAAGCDRHGVGGHLFGHEGRHLVDLIHDQRLDQLVLRVQGALAGELGIAEPRRRYVTSP